ncbi:MAG: FecR domain-containing protein [Tannerellaceae bacterium]|jgi:ferric-dicitrate binding protein FerR (iron transport regulator)|nr:FecR domain-containing protein [Tannerellaceae bacterium]
MEKTLLYKYFENRVTPEEEKDILNWIALSTDNYQNYLKERKLWNMLLLNSQDEETGARRRKRNPVLGWKITAIAASLALLVSLTGYLFKASGSNKNIHSVIVPPGQRTQLILEDGTKVWLNAKTTLTYVAQFDTDARKVTLNGEGYFEVKPEKNRPFIIITERYNVNVLGTTINVCAYNNSANPFELSLLTGKAYLEDSAGAGADIQLKPNESVTEQKGVLHKAPITSYDRFRWKDGMICLDDEPFNTLMEKFAEYYAIKIIVKNKAYNNYRCTGTFRMNDGVDYALRVLQRDVKFNYKRNDEAEIITIY